MPILSRNYAWGYSCHNYVSFSIANCRPTLLVYAVRAALEALNEDGPLISIPAIEVIFIILPQFFSSYDL